MIAQRTARPFNKIMKISPEQAIHWLETCNTNNRKVCDRHVQKLARDMTDGKWVLTGDLIRFGTGGTLLDGQHRLWAVCMSGVTIESFVGWNIDERARMAIDNGKSRIMVDVLNLAGNNGSVCAHRLAALRALLGGFGDPPTLSSAETSLALREHEEALEFALTHLPGVHSAKGVNTAATRAVIARAYYSVDHALLVDFCRKLTTGIVTSDEERVIVLLRQHLQENRGASLSRRMQRYGKVERGADCLAQRRKPQPSVSGNHRTVPTARRGDGVTT